MSPFLAAPLPPLRAGNPSRTPPYPRGCATVKRRCRRMLWFTLSLLNSTGELRGEPRGDPTGDDTPGDGSMAPIGAPKRSAGGPDPRGCERCGAGNARPFPPQPRETFHPLPPAPEKLNNCLLRPHPPPPPGAPTAPAAPREHGLQTRGPAPPAALLSPRWQLCPSGEDAVLGCEQRHAERRVSRAHGGDTPQCHPGTDEAAVPGCHRGTQHGRAAV